MNLALLTTLAFTTLIAAAPLIHTSPRRNLVPGLPTPMGLIEKLYPNSGIPKVASDVEGELGVCMFEYYRRGCLDDEMTR